MLKEITITTSQRYELIDITDQIERIVREENIDKGLIHIFVPHSTCAVLLTENEQGLKADWLKFLKEMVSGIEFQHNQIDNNADSHILSGLIGQGKTLVIENNNLIRGTWQQIMLAEFDGPRQRKIIIRI